MSGEESAEPPSPLQVDGAHDEEPVGTESMSKASHKSFRRKYRKMMVRFEDTMRQSTSLFKEEQNILDISQRLAEQNDQILELLSELNSCPQIPPASRYDLTPSGASVNSGAESGTKFDVLSAQSTLQQARQRLRDGEMKISEYSQLEDAILDSSAFVPQRSYTSLLKVPHKLAGPRYASTQESSSNPSKGCLTSTQEEQYTDGIDSFLAGKSTTARPHAANNLSARSAEKSAERERELQLRNPVSVYNWLRKHQPQVFLQDHESHAEKQTRNSGSRISKRAPTSGSAPIKQEKDLYDEEGIAIDAGHAARGKRKRDDDPGYRPKGGNSRPSKRNKEDAPPSARRSKKQSISIS